MEASTTGAATPSWWARSQLMAVTHQRSPGTMRDQVVAYHLLVREELPRHDRADSVATDVLRAGAAAAVAVETGEGIRPTGLKLAAKDVAIGHGVSIASTAALSMGG